MGEAGKPWGRNCHDPPKKSLPRYAVNPPCGAPGYQHPPPPRGGEEDGGELLDPTPDTVDHAEAYAVRTASRREIQEFSEKLAQFGLTFSDVADNCPRQERTFAACRRVLDLARTQPELLKRVEDTGKLPMGELSAGSGTDRKTMERHRKYLVAILLAFTNGYEIIRGHLCQVGPKRGGDEA